MQRRPFDLLVQSAVRDVGVCLYASNGLMVGIMVGTSCMGDCMGRLRETLGSGDENATND